MTDSLAEIDVLVLDCQATSAQPSRGELLEVGWARVRASGPEPVGAESHLVRSDPEPRIPRRVHAITGISPRDLRAGQRPERIWGRLRAAAREVARSDRLERCPTVIHYARFEEPFLRALHGESAEGFPLQIICTHELARRLVPRLPRKGLRAVAGYFGHGVGELRRSGQHVAATAHVWRAMVELLAPRGVHTLTGLQEWMARGDAPSRAEHRYPMDAELRLKLPDRPGVYRMRRSSGDVLYVGKARSLRRRVNSYFQKRSAHGERMLEMLAQARQLDVTETPSSLEAAILESDEIKRLAPPYNVALRDRGRPLAFWSADLSGWRGAPGGAYRLGPFPSPESLAPVAALAQLLAGTPADRAKPLVATWLGAPRTEAPLGCVVSGLALLTTRHPFAALPLAGAVLRLGTRLAAEGLEPAEHDSERVAEETAPDWTPERIRDLATASLVEGARAIRRALWICRLSESRLSWSEGDSPRSLLVSEAEAHSTPSPAPLRDPPFDLRRRGFDRACYDRMSAVIRELKRLVKDGGAVELRFGSRRRLSRDDLARALRWV